MNKHASAVLDVYLDTEKHAVAHAVLIEGRWGSGKTHFIQHIYEPRRFERLRRRYVNRAGFRGGSNSQVGWSHDEQNDEQVFA